MKKKNIKSTEELIDDIRESIQQAERTLDDLENRIEHEESHNEFSTEAVLDAVRLGLPMIEFKYGLSSMEAEEVRRFISAESER